MGRVLRLKAIFKEGAVRVSWIVTGVKVTPCAWESLRTSSTWTMKTMPS